MMPQGCRALLLAVLIVLVGCSPSDDLVVRGEYFYNFENAALTPEGKDECWEVEGDMSDAELPGNEPSGPWGRSAVVVSGVLSPPGEFGNMGTCTHAFTVTQVLSVEHLRQGP